MLNKEDRDLALSLTGEICEVGDVVENTPGFRMGLPDGRVITVLGLTRREVIQIGGSLMLQDATLTLAKEPQ